mmetsp:Transcript_89/g.133  ORF Transcript_89/g.133 Transcript_89/m.133 type:complete len:215 (+) Transcript_89:231-875(+)|eukprot:CAMPEP_0197285222 /NCGR_PEP_ID=MMETSP0890-20130614/447_1 /TAXON_ID=44058 ORGANISM="Aureoumbra lagunensis, Strain CCMP1510" /NCGR_SAMPLE_ID=MMETSP0890 /ASSEMBLY_ACC=CAM_ASM_000533 /LENGTH=214 /DNA_ID=CAMNT_0042752523 /DNA_START=233 /DNA_END=877 /DNA_ORIENTATION=+
MPTSGVIEQLPEWPSDAVRLRYDNYGFPTIECRMEQRQELNKLCVCVQARLAPWAYKLKLKEAKAVVCKLRGDRSAQSISDLGILLEFCAHAKALAPGGRYSDELRKVIYWLVAEAKNITYPAIPTVHEYSDEEEEDMEEGYNDNQQIFQEEEDRANVGQLSCFYLPEEEAKGGDSSLVYNRQKEEFARLLCDFAHQRHPSQQEPVFMVCDDNN